MLVVDVTQWYAPRSGGIRTYLHAKAAYAAVHGHRHAIVVPGARAAIGTVEESTAVQVYGVPTGQAAGYRLIPRPTAIVGALERLQPTVVVLHDSMAFPRSLARWARSRGVPVVLFVHSDLADAAAVSPGALRPPIERILSAMQSRGMHVPDALVTTSNAGADRLRERHGLRPLVSHLGVDTDVFHPRAADPALRRSLAEPTETLLIHAGRLSPEKHPLLLVDALAKLHPECVLAIAGEGSEEQALRRRAEHLRLSGRLRLLGHIADRRRLADLYAAADCYVHANPREPFGLAPLEALASGCRVVVPHDAGCAELMGDEAVTVAAGSAAALAHGVATALQRPRPSVDVSRLSLHTTFEREWALYRLLSASTAESRAA